MLSNGKRAALGVRSKHAASHRASSISTHQSRLRLANCEMLSHRTPQKCSALHNAERTATQRHLGGLPHQVASSRGRRNKDANPTP